MNGRGEVHGQAQARDARRVPRSVVLPAVLCFAVTALFGALLVLGGAAGAPVGLLGVLALAMLIGAAALGWHVGVVKARETLGAALRDAREQAQIQAQLQRDWHWATDLEHHLVRWQAPQGAPASSWVGQASTQKLAERFVETAVVAEVLERERSFEALAVSEASGARYVLRGVASRDSQGRFNGFQGAAAVVPAVSAPAPQAAADEHEAFAYLVSHDLRAPLRVAEGFARILREDYAASGRPFDALASGHLDRIGGAVGRMQQMIDALLALTQLSSAPLEQLPVDLSRIAGEITEDLRRSAPERAADFRVAPGLVVTGDPVLLRVLLENLLGNAWKYSAACARAEIRFEAGEQGGRPCFIVSDNGAGFDMQHAARLFEVFQRLHAASEFPGHGVGLASVRRIARRHGGEAWAESAPGQGARFYFTVGDRTSSEASSRAAC